MTLAREQEKTIALLRKRVICGSKQQKALQGHGKVRVAEIHGGNTDAFKQKFRSTINMLWIDYRKRFDVRSYRDTREVDYDSAVDWINLWHPNKLPPALPEKQCFLCETVPATTEVDGEQVCKDCADLLNGAAGCLN